MVYRLGAMHEANYLREQIGLEFPSKFSLATGSYTQTWRNPPAFLIVCVTYPESHLIIDIASISLYTQLF
ncbi:hypothetical protein BDW42DRAFT_158251 [Aspergillus taichungensis]|uniref:Uncharacterized protein n=1 Tax=Aspergillus taichungensis TaxID=482145 RepID=A0A2J5I9D7_9EURO|nr:hypothetical protein BDW42DRAFT_158251 [Aspergillus taichungensis]